MEKDKTAALVVALQKGEQDAAKALYSAFYNDIYYFILKTVKDPHLAEDLTQDTFMEILDTIGNLRMPAAFVPWSKKIAYHRCTTYFKKRRDLLADEKEEGYFLMDLRAEERTEFIPEASLDQEDLRKTICSMLDSLPNEQRAAIVMRYYDEISIKDIAQIQKVSEGTVKSRLSYGRQAIKTSVEDFEKRHDVKLHCTGVIPLILWFFKEDRLRNGMSLTEMTPLAEAFSTVIHKATKAVVRKILAGVATAVVLFFGAGTLTSETRNPQNPDGPISSESLGSGTTDSEHNSTIDTIVPETPSSDTTPSQDTSPENSEDEPSESEPTGSQKPSESEKPSESQKPSESEKPSESQKPSESEEPSESETPSESEEPTKPEIVYSEGLSYTLSDDKISYWVSGIGTCQDDEINIPPEYNGLPVTGINNIAFSACRASRIRLPETITHIGQGAFMWCNHLKNLKIPKNVTSIGANITLACTSMTSIIVDEANPVYHSEGNCIIETNSKTLVAGCANSTIPDNGSVLHVGQGAFEAQQFMTDINIPKCLVSIAENAFDSVTFTNLHVSENLISIDPLAFDSSRIQTLTVEPGNPVYHSSGNCLIETESQTVILGCTNSIIPTTDNVKYIGGSAFKNNRDLTSIFIPDNIIAIRDNAFVGCSSLSKVTLSQNLKEIGVGAFSECSSLESLLLPDSLESIEYYSFSNCTSLTTMIIPKNVKELGTFAFSNCTNLKELIVSEENPYYHSVENCIIETATMTLLFSNSDGYIPEDAGILRIHQSLFYGNANLVSVTIPEGVQTIGSQAFDSCSKLTSVSLPASLTDIGYYAFWGSTNLVDIYYAGTMEQWASIFKGTNWNPNNNFYVIHCTDGDITP